MIFSEKECTAAAVYTQNKVKGAPILVTKANLAQSGGKAQAVIVNSKNANTCNANGVEVANAVCKLTADELGITADRVIVASTGVIGAPMSVEPFANAMHELAEGLSIDGHDAAAKAIIVLDNEMSSVRSEIMDAQNSSQIQRNLITDILNNIENLYKLTNKREVEKIQDEFYHIYAQNDMQELKRFHKELDLIAEGYRAQAITDEL